MKRYYVASVLISLVLLPELASARNIGPDPPNGMRHRRHRRNLYSVFLADDGDAGFLNDWSMPEPYDSGTSISATEGNLTEEIPVSRIGTTLDLSFLYNSYNADGTRTTVDTVMGYGWTHSYNDFMFSQAGVMFRYDGEGRVTRFGLGPGGTFVAATGYFETLTTSGGMFTLTEKDQTKYTYASIPGTPFLVGGPVYRIITKVDRNHNTTTFTYSGGNLTKVTDTYGRSLTFTYNVQNKLASVTDPLGRVTTVTYDSTGHKLTQITDPIPNSLQYTYNTFYQITGKTDKAGRTFTYIYSSGFPGLPVAVKDSSGFSRSLFSNPSNWATDPTQLAIYLRRVYVASTTTNTDGRGNPWKYIYDTDGYVTQTIAPDGATISYTYDPATLGMASMTDANGHVTTYMYDAMGNRIKHTDALGHVTANTYESTFNMMTSATDALGRVTTYTIDPANGNRTAETDPLGHTRTWTYDANGNVLTDTDKNGHTTVYQYDAFGQPVKIADPLGNITTMTYDAAGNMVRRTDANRHATGYQFDGMNRVTTITDPSGHTDQTAYDGEGNRIQTTDRNGHVTQLQYDVRARLSKTTDALSQTETYTYDGDDNRISLTDRDGHTTNYGYDVQNRRTSITDALGHTASTTYDPVGNVISETDANGHTTTNTYDALNRRATTTDALSEVTQYQYDTGTFAGCSPSCGATPGSSLITGETDPNGKVTYTKYDALNRMIDRVRKVGSTADTITPSDAVTTHTYDPLGNRLTITEPDGNTSTSQYDADDRRIKETNAAGDVTMTTYDGVGNMITVTAPNLNVTTNTYDSLNRLVTVTDSAGTVGSYTYDPVGNRLSATDGNGNTTSRLYDAVNRLITTTDPLAQSTATQYDAEGNAVKISDRNGNATTYTYDAINRRTSMTDALSNTTQWQYDPVGNLIRLTDSNGHATQYTYDAVNRPSNEMYPDGLMRIFTHDGVGNVLTRTDQIGQVTHYTYNDLYFQTSRTYPSAINDAFTYDLSGRMLTAQRGTWPVTFTYDGADRITQTTQNGHVIGYLYNIPGRTRQLTYPGGRVITEHTDARTRMDHIDDVSSPSIVQYSYDAGNRVLSRTYRNGTTAAFSYNNNDWVLSLQNSHGPTLIAGFNYVYDNEGNKQFENKLHDLTHSECYAYDAAYRLIGYKVGTTPGCAVPLTQTSYSLDPVGNWNSKTTDAVTQTRAHNVDNELTMINAQALTYDADGNAQNDGAYTYAYDEENRLTAVKRNSDSAVVGQYVYDALSRRVQKIATPAGSPATTRYYYDDARIVEEQDGLNVTQATYVYGKYVDEILTIDRGGAYYYHQNALWSVEAITDSTATPVERYAYDAYGSVTVTNGTGTPVAPNAWGTPHSAIGNPWTFTGRQLDEESGLYFYRARSYDPQKGRYLQRDPQGYDDGTNLYEYVGDRPTALTDPTGMAGKPVAYLGTGPFPSAFVQYLNATGGWPKPGYQLPPPGPNMPQSLWGTLSLYAAGVPGVYPGVVNNGLPGPDPALGFSNIGFVGRAPALGWRPENTGTWYTSPPPPGRSTPAGVWSWLNFFAALSAPSHGPYSGPGSLITGVTAPGEHGPPFQVSQHVPILVLPQHSFQVTSGVSAPGPHGGPFQISQHVPILAIPPGSVTYTTGISTPGPHTTGPPVTPWTQSFF